MYVVVLIAFVVALSLSQQPPLVAARWPVLPAVTVYLAGAVAVGAFKTALSLRAIGPGPDVPGRALRRHNLMNIAGQLWLIAGLAGVMLLGYGRWVLADLRLDYVPLIGKAVVLAPFVAALLVSWRLEYPFYRALRGRIARQQILLGETARAGWNLREYFSYNLRHQLLFVAVPVGLIVLVIDIVQLSWPYLPEAAAEPIALGVSGLWAAAVFLCAPLLIVRVWRTAPLPDGPLRDDLLAMCRRMRLRCRRLLVWLSGGMIANAGVMGLIGRVRYVLLSDALLEQMEQRQIKAIFAHEAGHIISHHLFYAMLFAVSAVTVCGAVGDAVAASLAAEPWLAETVTVALLLAGWGVGFGWLSRRFERQSDAIGAWASALEGPHPDGRVTPEGAAIFAGSLERVAVLNGIPTHQRNWRHGSIASRVDYILWLGSTGGSRQQIDRVVRRIKLALWAATACAAAIVTVRLVTGW